MNRTRALAPVLVALLAACAPITRIGGGGEREDLWREAHLALAANEFSAADSLFTRLAAASPERREGREAVFYLGALRLDPRNPAWSSRQSAEQLRRYLAVADSLGPEAIMRRAEAQIFLELASQLNMPVADRIPALQPDTVVRTRVVPGAAPPRRVVSGEEARNLAAEVERLRRELGEREETIRRQREELDRIRKTLAPGRRP